jgi:diaminohydroxyphosphoribosylaminopyrimidine deaminase/5-amino-6-(5-phosphoribosylamino)uracil reductase
MEYLYMQRCFDLARLGAGSVSPNPMVGAVLVYANRIIGEGYHHAHGQPHAEVNAIANVQASDQHLIKESTLYVSLEPCCIYGKTPPCTNLIIAHQIPRVVIAALDQTPGVNGKGVALLRAAGVEVRTSVLENAGKELAQIRNTFVQKNRPYVILKYAISQDQKLAPLHAQQFWLSNAFSKRLVHRWRMESDAILVGTNTAATDNPALSNRLYYGSSPIRIVLDRNLRLAPALKLFDKQQTTLVFTSMNQRPPDQEQIEYITIDYSKPTIPQILNILVKRKITSLIVEGGKQVLEGFIQANLWDEARVFQTNKWIGSGLSAPDLNQAIDQQYTIASDQLFIYKNQ